MLEAAEEAAVGLGHVVLAVIVHHGALLVQQRVAAWAVPLEAVDLALPAASLGDEREGVGGKRGECGTLPGMKFVEPSGMTATCSFPSGVR